MSALVSASAAMPIMDARGHLFTGRAYDTGTVVPRTMRELTGG
jgi:hypothetical protein